MLVPQLPNSCPPPVSQVGNALALTGGGAGGPSVVDLISGATSKGERFIDIYRRAAKSPG